MWKLRAHPKRTIYDLVQPTHRIELCEHQGPARYYHLTLLNNTKSCAALYHPEEGRVTWSHEHAPSVILSHATKLDGLPAEFKHSLNALLEGLFRGDATKKEYVFTPAYAQRAANNPSRGSRSRTRP